MSIKLLVRQGGGAASEPDIAMLGDREGLAVFEQDQPLILMGQRWEQGTSSVGQFIHVNPQDTNDYRFRPHAEVKLVEDETSPDTTLAFARIEGGVDVGREFPFQGGVGVMHTVQVMDSNLDLRGIPYQVAWSRPAETSWERLQALAASKLNGSSSTSSIHRETTDITVDSFANGHLVDASSPVDLDAKEYPIGSHVGDILMDIMEEWGMGWGVTVHHDGGSHKCLLVQEPGDLTSFTSDLKISDQVADWDPEDLTAPVLEPHWKRGDGKLSDNSETISGLISIYGGTNDDPRHVYVETGEAPEEFETWVDVFNDDLAKNETQATRRANHILNDRKRAYHTYRPSILLLPEQVGLITAGQAIECKSVVFLQGVGRDNYQWLRIVEIQWEPNHDGRWWAHLDLDRPKNTRARGGGGQPIPTTPEPPPECIPVPDDVITVLSDSSIGDWGSTVTTGACWGGDPHRSIGGSGQLSPSVAVTAGDVIRGSLNFRDETGNDTWENVDNYNYEGYLQFTGTGMPTLSYQIVNQRYHNMGCINVTHSRTETVPSGYTSARVLVSSRLGGYQFNGTISEVDPADVPDNDEFCLPEGSGGSSPYYARSDDPRFTNDDQHLTTKIQERVVNNSGGTLQVGDVVVPDTTQTDPSVTTTTTASSTDAMVGIVTTAGADGETIVVMWEGVFLLPLNDGAETPAVGDYIYTSTTAGAASFDATRTEGAVGRVIAVDGSNNTAYVLWWGVPDSGTGTPPVTDHGDLTGLGDDDHPQYYRTTDGGKDVINVVAASGSTETLDVGDGNFHDVTLTADCTLTLSGSTNGVACYMTILLRQGTGAPWDVTWPGSVEWVGGGAPTLETAEDAWNVVSLVTLDGGTTWFGDGGGGGTASLSDDTPLIESGAGDPGVSTDASRSDHVHPLKSQSGILLESGHSVPFTFDEILQESDGSDFLWASE